MSEFKNANDLSKPEWLAAKRKILGLGDFRNRDRPASESTGDSLLKSAALNAGIVDLDALKLADTTNVNLNDRSAVAAVIGNLKKAKPYLFGVGKNAKDMTDAEWRAARARLPR